MSRFRISYKGKSVGPSNLRPFRKRIALTIMEGNKERILGYFRSEAAAKEFGDFISGLPLTVLDDTL